MSDVGVKVGRLANATLSYERAVASASGCWLGSRACRIVAARRLPLVRVYRIREVIMQYRIRKFAAIAMTAVVLPLGACGRHSDRQTSNGEVSHSPTSTPSAAANHDTVAMATHHSKLKGALVGAAIGHAMGHHALAGAAVGALAQHERNKHPR
jgi:hypothetical protein